MLLSDEYISLYTSSKQALQIIYILKKYFNNLNNITIVDATAGIGGNSLYFCKYFNFVYCIDTYDEAINYLHHNLSDFENKFIINHNCLDILKLIKFDVIFFDPPWGGNQYKFINKLNLYINEININKIIDNLYFNKNIKLIALKAPNNFNLNVNSDWIVKEHKIYKADNETVLFKLITYKRQ